jgi:branched-chain amino acid aminotransferase
MLLPVDDRTATRAHGVFDVLYLKKKCIINMNQHISRLFKSAASVNITPPFDIEKTEKLVVEVVE